MPTSFTIPTPRVRPTTNLTLSSPFAQPGAPAAPVDQIPGDIMSRLRAITSQAPETGGIVGTLSDRGTPFLTNRPEAALGLSDDEAFGAFDQMTAYGTPQEALADFIRGSKNSARTNRLNEQADQALDVQRTNQRLLGDQRGFERGQRSLDTVSNVMAQGEGEARNFLSPRTRAMREEVTGQDIRLQESKNQPDLAKAHADMYVADRNAQSREAAIPPTAMRALADILDATALDKSPQAQAIRGFAAKLMEGAGNFKVFTQADLEDTVARSGLTPDEVIQRAEAAGYVMVP